MSLDLTPGVHRIEPAMYHADLLRAEITLSRSVAQECLLSAEHAWTAHPRLNPDYAQTEKPSFNVGKAAHRTLLGRGADLQVFPPDLRDSAGKISSKSAKALKAEFEAEGLTVVSRDDVDRCEAMAAKARPFLASIGIAIDPDYSELTALADVDGVLCRSMYDNCPVKPMHIPGLGKRMVHLDFKTTRDASPAGCQRAVESYGYDFQRAFYGDTWVAAGEDPRVMLFLFQESEPPFGCGAAFLLDEPNHSADYGQRAREKVAVARSVWREALVTNHWPCYPSGILQIGAHPFHNSAWDDRAATLAQVSKPSAETIARARAWQAPMEAAE